MDKDHHFTLSEQLEYDSLNAKGRTYYDRMRWYESATHGVAFQEAKSVCGLKSKELTELEGQLAMIQNGIDPRITWR
jgi:hypothetical protein